MHDERDDRGAGSEGALFEQVDCDSPDEELELLQQWAQNLDESAFKRLVRRHAGWIRAQCLRGLRQFDLAEEATQAVFLVLSRRAKEIPAGTRLSGWLYNAAQFVIFEFRRRERRRLHHESKAFQAQQARLRWAKRRSQSCLEADLDAALASVAENDRNVLLLRFYEGMDLAQVGRALGITREGAKKRLSRALDRLRRLLGPRGSSSLAVAAVLAGWGRAEASENTVARLIGITSGRTVASRSCLALAELLLRRTAGKLLIGSVVGAQVAAILLAGVFFLTRDGGRAGDGWIASVQAVPIVAKQHGAKPEAPPDRQSSRDLAPAEPGDEGEYRRWVGEADAAEAPTDPTVHKERVESVVAVEDAPAGEPGALRQAAAETTVVAEKAIVRRSGGAGAAGAGPALPANQSGIPRQPNDSADRRGQARISASSASAHSDTRALEPEPDDDARLRRRPRPGPDDEIAPPVSEPPVGKPPSTTPPVTPTPGNDKPSSPPRSLPFDDQFGINTVLKDTDTVRTYRLDDLPSVSIVGNTDETTGSGGPDGTAQGTELFAPLPTAVPGEFYLLARLSSGGHGIYRGSFESAAEGTGGLDGRVIGASFRAGDARTMGFANGRFTWESDWWLGLAIDPTPVQTIPAPGQPISHGSGAPPALATTVPEPGAMVLAAGSCLLMLRRSHRHRRAN